LSRTVVLRPRARDDLREIWLYTRQGWDAAQADEYVRQIERAIRGIADAPMLGSDRGHIRHLLFPRQALGPNLAHPACTA
jgi:plasmid stabilization system protein ParE